jgi:hypothetical protein
MAKKNIKDFYEFKRIGYPTLWKTFKNFDTPGVFYDISERITFDPVWHNGITTTYLHIFRYNSKKARIDSLNTFIIKGHQAKGLAYVGDICYDEKLGIAVISLPDVGKEVIAYDVQGDKLFAEYECLDNKYDAEPLIISDIDIFLTYLRNNGRLRPDLVTNLNTLANILSNDYIHPGICYARLDMPNQSIQLVNNKQIVNLTLKDNKPVISGNIKLLNIITNVVSDRNLAITTTPEVDKIFDVYSINPTRHLFSVHFSQNSVRFQTENGRYAEFYTIKNRRASAADYFLNRPDLIYSMLYPADHLNENIYNRVVMLRQAKSTGKPFADIDTSTRPQVKHEIPFVSLLTDTSLKKLYFQQDNIKLSFMATDSLSIVKAYDVSVNGVPIINHLKLSNPAASLTGITSNISLSSGRNEIDLTVTNTEGIQSEPAKYICYNTAAPNSKIRTYFVGVGMSQYKDSSKNLYASDKDIRAVVKKMSINPEFNLADTLINLTGGLKERFKKEKTTLMATGIDDNIIIMLSGHGLLSNGNRTWNFAGYETNFNDPDTATCITYNDLNKLLEGVPARNRLIIIDACHAGQSFFDYVETDINTGAVTQRKEKGKDGSNIATGLPFKIADGFSVFKPAGYFLPVDYEAFKIIMENFPDYNRDGATVLTASRGEQTAKEYSGQGYFTAAFLQVMEENKRGTVTINKLITEINKKFAQSAGQKPSLKGYNPSADWLIW